MWASAQWREQVSRQETPTGKGSPPPPPPPLTPPSPLPPPAATAAADADAAALPAMWTGDAAGSLTVSAGKQLLLLLLTLLHGRFTTHACPGTSTGDCAGTYASSALPPAAVNEGAASSLATATSMPLLLTLSNTPRALVPPFVASFRTCCSTCCSFPLPPPLLLPLAMEWRCSWGQSFHGRARDTASLHTPAASSSDEPRVHEERADALPVLPCTPPVEAAQESPPCPVEAQSTVPDAWPPVARV